MPMTKNSNEDGGGDAENEGTTSVESIKKHAKEFVNASWEEHKQ